MDIKEIIDFKYEEIEGLKQKLSEDQYMNPEQEDELEELIAKSIKFGELCAQRDAKASVVPGGFVLVDEDVLEEIKDSFSLLLEDIALHRDFGTEFTAKRDFNEVLERVTKLKAMIEAQEPSNDS